jgi:hypothetical protein
LYLAGVIREHEFVTYGLFDEWYLKNIPKEFLIPCDKDEHVEELGITR